MCRENHAFQGRIQEFGRGGPSGVLTPRGPEPNICSKFPENCPGSSWIRWCLQIKTNDFYLVCAEYYMTVETKSKRNMNPSHGDWTRLISPLEHVTNTSCLRFRYYTKYVTIVVYRYVTLRQFCQLRPLRQLRQFGCFSCTAPILWQRPTPSASPLS